MICCITPCNFYIVFLLAGPDTGIMEIKVSAVNCYRIGVLPEKYIKFAQMGEGADAKTNRFMFYLIILSVG